VTARTLGRCGAGRGRCAGTACSGSFAEEGWEKESDAGDGCDRQGNRELSLSSRGNPSFLDLEGALLTVEAHTGGSLSSP